MKKSGNAFSSIVAEVFLWHILTVRRCLLSLLCKASDTKTGKLFFWTHIHQRRRRYKSLLEKERDIEKRYGQIVKTR